MPQIALNEEGARLACGARRMREPMQPENATAKTHQLEQVAVKEEGYVLLHAPDD